MTPEKEHLDLFGADLIAEREINKIKFALYSNRIFHVTVPRYEKVGPEVINTGYQFLDINGGGKFYNIYEFDSFSDIDENTRKWAADPDGNQYTYTDAIVIGNIGQKIITDFYMRFDKPVSPTKVFFTLEKAIEWTLQQMK